MSRPPCPHPSDPSHGGLGKGWCDAGREGQQNLAEKQRRIEDRRKLSAAVAEAYDAEGQRIWWTAWDKSGDGKRRRMAAFVNVTQAAAVTCLDCGALIQNEQVHDQWHDNLADAVAAVVVDAIANGLRETGKVTR